MCCLTTGRETQDLCDCLQRLVDIAVGVSRHVGVLQILAIWEMVVAGSVTAFHVHQLQMTRKKVAKAVLRVQQDVGIVMTTKMEAEETEEFGKVVTVKVWATEEQRLRVLHIVFDAH